MAEATKSLAAEIEAVLRANTCDLGHADEPDRYLIVDVKKAAAEIAALQGRAFEDGARKRLTQALAVHDAAERNLAAAEAVHQDICNRMGDEPDIGEIMDRVGAEQACMQASMAKGIARADLVSAVRATLPLQPEGESDA